MQTRAPDPAARSAEATRRFYVFMLGRWKTPSYLRRVASFSACSSVLAGKTLRLRHLVQTPRMRAPQELERLTHDEAVQRLRALRQPATLFGESDRDRLLRLAAAERTLATEARSGSSQYPLPFSPSLSPAASISLMKVGSAPDTQHSLYTTWRLQSCFRTVGCRLARWLFIQAAEL